MLFPLLIDFLNKFCFTRKLLNGGLTICTPRGQRCSLINHVYEDLDDFKEAKLQLIYYSKRTLLYAIISTCPWVLTALIRIRFSLCTHNPQRTFRIINRNKRNSSYTTGGVL